MAERAKKRPLPQDEFDPPPPAQRRARFPKAKKAKKGGDELPLDGDGGDDNWMDPQLAAKERAKRRNQMREDELLGGQVEGFLGEVQYEETACIFYTIFVSQSLPWKLGCPRMFIDDSCGSIGSSREDKANFENDGIRVEPFNLKEEREEGYFDANGNFVEYAKQNEIKDAWLDSVEVDTSFAEKFQPKSTAEEVYEDLSSDDIGKIKRRIADALQPGETIIQALKRLKGTSTDKKAKMLDVTKQIFDQLTEDAMKLMENGEYNVYYEEQETFVREAEGYERLVRARTEGTSSTKSVITEWNHGEDIFSDDMQHGEQESAIWDIHPGPSAVNVSVQQALPSDGGDKIDMFGDNDENANENLPVPSDASSASAFQHADQLISGSLDSSQDLDSGDVGDGGVGNDYVYDQSSGYYYSSSLGYYYDPASGMYCCGTTGTWYTFDEQSGTYTEIQSSTTTGS